MERLETALAVELPVRKRDIPGRGQLFDLSVGGFDQRRRADIDELADPCSGPFQELLDFTVYSRPIDGIAQEQDICILFQRNINGLCLRADFLRNGLRQLLRVSSLCLVSDSNVHILPSFHLQGFTQK